MIDKAQLWRPPDGWIKIISIDAHTAGEPFRVITGGLPELEGDTVLARRRWARANIDHLRRALMWEPRGHADMYGCILSAPVLPDSDISVLFIHNEGYSTMCGHGIIGLATVMVETGMIELRQPETTIRIDTPAGQVTAHARIENGRAQSVYFDNVPSFALALDESVDVEGIGCVKYDLAFGGAFYAYVDSAQVGLTCAPENFRALIEAGMAIKRAVAASRAIRHPFEEDLSFLYGTILSGPAQSPDANLRNVCVFAEGEVDRSPTGTGVSGRVAIEFARGRLKPDQPFIVESIIGTRFTGSIVESISFGPHNAVISRIEGSAFITGRHEFLIDPQDPLREGFFLR
ncbi:MAG TPA: proline racemase family protein [Blastocatellia bacterium]|jgi:trans-L-3-hydroxyproline dehydratase